MAATFVTNAELRTALGIGSLYADSIVDEVCQAAENTVYKILWRPRKFNTRQSLTNDVACLTFDDLHDFYIGQTVVVTLNGSPFNGNKTITAIDTYSIYFTAVHADIPDHAIIPYGEVEESSYVDYGTIPEIREATLMVAVDIWQARNSSNEGGTSPDFTPSPYKMGNTLLARVRGLLGSWYSPRSYIG